jgi:ABC-2 type transport system ATP-binding protein
MAAVERADDPRGEVRAAPAVPAIHMLDLAKRYGHVQALAGLSMTVPRGEVFGFLGPNGAGKTTAVKILVGLTRPTSGEAWLLGEPLGDREVRRRIGYLPELFRYQDWMSAREVLALHCDLMGMARVKRSEHMDRVLGIVNLAARAGDRVGTFSKGMQQRLGLAVALLGEPELVFLDEPTSALDPVGRHDVREIIRDLKARGTTVFLNSHLLTEVEQVCDRVAIIDRSRVIALGTLDELRGVEHVVRVRAAGDRSIIVRAASHFGEVAPEGEWYTVRGLDATCVPDLVAALVRAGARVFAVDPVSQSLEDRFLQLLGGTHDDRVDDCPPDPA